MDRDDISLGALNEQIGGLRRDVGRMEKSYDEIRAMFASSSTKQGERIGLLETEARLMKAEISGLAEDVKERVVKSQRNALLVFGLLQAVFLAVFGAVLRWVVP